MRIEQQRGPGRLDEQTAHPLGRPGRVHPAPPRPAPRHPQPPGSTCPATRPYDRIAVQHTVQHRHRRVLAAAQRPRASLGRRAVGDAPARRRRRAAGRRPHLRAQPAGQPGLPAAARRDQPRLVPAADRSWSTAARPCGPRPTAGSTPGPCPAASTPGGLLNGWAVERAATRLRAAGIADYAVLSGADLTVRGHAGARRPVAGRGAPSDRRPAGPAGAGDDRRRGRAPPASPVGAGTSSTRTPANRPGSWSPPPSSARTSRSPTPTPPRSTPPGRWGCRGSAPTRDIRLSSPTGAAERHRGASADLWRGSTGWRGRRVGDQPPRSRQRPWGPVSDECAWLAHSRGAGRPAGRPDTSPEDEPTSDVPVTAPIR